MRVAYDHQIFSSQRFGGVSRYFYELANHMPGFENGVVDFKIISPVYINEYLRQSKSELGIMGLYLPFVPRVSRIYNAVNNYISLILFRGWYPDIVHETYYSSESVAPSDSLIVVTVYDMIHELYPECFPANDSTSKDKKIAVDRADHVICISKNTQKDLIRLLGVAPEKTSVIYLGFALTQNYKASQTMQKRPFILYVGSRGGYKNFGRLLEAYASCSELYDKFDLISFGGGAFNKQEMEMIRQLNLSNTQVKQIEGDDSILAALYMQATLFVYPSLYEGFGIPPLEAMSFNCPVACSNTSSIPEVVGNASIQFDPLDINSIANALISLSSDSTLRENLIKLGRVRVKEFSWEQCAMQTLSVYRALLK